MKLTAAESEEIRRIMVQAATDAMADRPDGSAELCEALVNPRQFEVIIRRTLDEESPANDPILTGLCKWIRYSNEVGGLSPGDCLDVQITIRSIWRYIPVRKLKLFGELKDLLESAVADECGVEFIGPTKR